MSRSLFISTLVLSLYLVTVLTAPISDADVHDIGLTRNLVEDDDVAGIASGVEPGEALSDIDEDGIDLNRHKKSNPSTVCTTFESISNNAKPYNLCIQDPYPPSGSGGHQPVSYSSQQPAYPAYIPPAPQPSYAYYKQPAPQYSSYQPPPPPPPPQPAYPVHSAYPPPSAYPPQPKPYSPPSYQSPKQSYPLPPSSSGYVRSSMDDDMDVGSALYQKSKYISYEPPSYGPPLPPPKSYSYPSPAPQVPCSSSLLFSCQPSVQPVPCQSPKYPSYHNYPPPPSHYHYAPPPPHYYPPPSYGPPKYQTSFRTTVDAHVGNAPDQSPIDSQSPQTQSANIPIIQPGFGPTNEPDFQSDGTTIADQSSTTQKQIEENRKKAHTLQMISNLQNQGEQRQTEADSNRNYNYLGQPQWQQ